MNEMSILLNIKSELQHIVEALHAVTNVDIIVVDEHLDRVVSTVKKEYDSGISGMLCDGAKIGCSYKLSISVDAAVDASEMALKNIFIPADNGILGNTPEKTIINLAQVSNIGMLNEKCIKILKELDIELYATLIIPLDFSKKDFTDLTKWLVDGKSIHCCRFRSSYVWLSPT